MLRTSFAIHGILILIAACAASTALADPSEISHLEALLADPENAQDIMALHGTLGDQYLAQGNPTRALEHFDQLVNLHPNHPLGQFRRGETLQRMGHMREAIETFERAGSLGYTASDVLAHIGFCNMVLWRRTDSISEKQRVLYFKAGAGALSRALQLDPNHMSALGNMADMAFNQGQLEAALKLYARMNDLGPDAATTLSRLGSTHAALGNHREALVFLRRSIDIAATPAAAKARPWVLKDALVLSHFRLAESLFALNRPAEAREEFENILAVAHCPGCNETSEQVEHFAALAREHLANLDREPVPASSDTGN